VVEVLICGRDSGVESTFIRANAMIVRYAAYLATCGRGVHVELNARHKRRWLQRGTALCAAAFCRCGR